MKNHKKSILTFALLFVVGISMYLIAGTYAKYTSEITANGTVSVAKWAFEDDNKITALDIELTETVDASTLVADKIAPGTSGSFIIKLTNENTEVGVDFEIAFTDVTNKPTYLKFYSDDSFSTEIDPTSDTITGQLEAKDADGLEVPIYWQWAYESGADTTDTTEGKAAKDLTIGLTITGTQVEPSSTAITSQVD